MSFDYAALSRRIAALESNRGGSLRFGTVTEVSEEPTAVASGSEPLSRQAAPIGLCPSASDAAQCGG